MEAREKVLSLKGENVTGGGLGFFMNASYILDGIFLPSFEKSARERKSLWVPFCNFFLFVKKHVLLIEETQIGCRNEEIFCKLLSRLEYKWLGCVNKDASTIGGNHIWSILSTMLNSRSFTFKWKIIWGGRGRDRFHISVINLAVKFLCQPSCQMSGVNMTNEARTATPVTLYLPTITRSWDVSNDSKHCHTDFLLGTLQHQVVSAVQYSYTYKLVMTQSFGRQVVLVNIDRLVKSANYNSIKQEITLLLQPLPQLRSLINH